jgi:hypothetical protein
MLSLAGQEDSNRVRVGNVARERFALGTVGEVVGVVGRIGADHIHGNVHRAVEAQLAEEDDVITDDIRGAHAARVALDNARGGRGRSDRRAARSLWFSCPVDGWLSGAAERLCAARR